MRRVLGLKAKSKVLIEERDGGIFIQPVRRKAEFAPIEYLPQGAIKLSEGAYELDSLAGEDDVPRQ
jgi:bifunctional DNA-binding transcriptional regulator/antitoxin component of YhaV-PrlF toxin-antitoxin module